LEEFVIILQELLRGGVSGNSFQLIKIPEHIGRTTIDLDDAQNLRLKCRVHFSIYGRGRLRNVGDQQIHLLDLEGIVAYKAIPREISEKFGSEFAELLPRHVRIASQSDVFSFEFTSNWTNCVSRYIIGIVALLSGDLN